MKSSFLETLGLLAAIIIIVRTGLLDVRSGGPIIFNNNLESVSRRPAPSVYDLLND